MIATRSNGWIGVDIGTRNVKLAQVVRDQLGFRIIDAAVVPRPLPWSSETLSPQRPVSTRGEILAAHSIASRTLGRTAACCASTAFCSTASVPVDPETLAPDEEELAETLSLPSNTQAVVDFCLASQPPRNQHDAIVFAMTEPWSIQLATDIQDAGFRCQAIDAMQLALARATIIDSSTPRDRCVAAIDLGYSSTSFVVARDGEPCFVRSVERCRLRGLLDVLMDELDVTHDQVERLLMQVGAGRIRKRGSSNTSATSVAAAGGMASTQNLLEILKPALNELVEEIKRTFMYLQTHQATRVPSEIKLFGGGACVPGISELLSESLGISVSLWQPSGDTQNVDKTVVSLLGPACAVSMLAWEGKQ